MMTEEEQASMDAAHREHLRSSHVSLCRRTRHRSLRGRLMQAAGIVLHICGGNAQNITPFGTCVGEFTKQNNAWHTPFGSQVAVVSELESVTRPARDYRDHKIEHLDPNLYTCHEEQNIRVYRPDLQELNLWQEDLGQLKTITRSDKLNILKTLGSAETHGESFPTMPTINW